jgi:hypothetical protein
VAQLATVPDGVLVVREDDVRHLDGRGVDLSVAGVLKGLALDRDTFEVVGEFDQILILGDHPINLVTETRFRESGGELVEVVLELDLLPDRVAQVAVLLLDLAAGVQLLRREGDLAVVACSAVQTVTVVGFANARLTRDHRKSQVDVTQPAGVLSTVEPVLELNRGQLVGLRVIVHDHVAELVRPGHLLLDAKGLRQQHAAAQKSHDDHQPDPSASFHPVLPGGGNTPLPFLLAIARAGELSRNRRANEDRKGLIARHSRRKGTRKPDYSPVTVASSTINSPL